MVTETQTTQTAQRIKVGMTGLAVVLLLMALASAIFRSASKEKPVEVAGASKPEVVANISITNDTAPAAGAGEPLAELGVAPSSPDKNAAANQTTIIVPPAAVTHPSQAQPTH